ncbi:hypothetical protein [Streptomyces sp. NPDC051776]
MSSNTLGRADYQVTGAPMITAAPARWAAACKAHARVLHPDLLFALDL